MSRDRFSRWTPGVLPGARTAPPIQDAPQVATALTVTTAGVTFELDATPGHAYGPAPWGLGSYASAAAAIVGGYAPTVGDRVLVVFAGAGIETPVVVNWWR